MSSSSAAQENHLRIVVDDPPASVPTTEEQNPTPAPATPTSSSADTANTVPTPAEPTATEETKDETKDPKAASAPKKKNLCSKHQQKAAEKAAGKAIEKATNEDKAQAEAREREEKEKEEAKKKEEAEKEKEREREKEKEAEQKRQEKRDNRRSKKKSSRRRKYDSSSSDDSSEEDNAVYSTDDYSSSDSSDDEDLLELALMAALRGRSRKQREKKKQKARQKKLRRRQKREQKLQEEQQSADQPKAEEATSSESEKDKAGGLEFKRVDELWDKEIHDYKIQDSVPQSKIDKYSSYIFTVRRIFDYDSKYVETLVDVKSPLLRDALNDIMGDVKGVSFVEQEPEVEPNMLWIFLPEITEWVEKQSKEPTPESEKAKGKKKFDAKGSPIVPLSAEEKKLQVEHVNLLITYLKTDYESTTNTLNPLLENGMITYDLLWAVLKPNTIMYTTCAGSNEPRAFRLEYAQKNSSFMRGTWYSIEGRYLEYDGKDGRTKSGEDGGGFGWGTIMVDIDGFKGARKITGLSCYPLKYRKDETAMKEKLVERGKKFVSLRGMQYKSHDGLAFMKKKRQYAKVHVKGRIMIDPCTFRRINPNYLVSSVKSRNNEAEEDEEANYFYAEDASDDEDENCSQCGCCGDKEEEDEEERARKAMTLIKDDKGHWQVVTKGDLDDKAMKTENIEVVEEVETEKAKKEEPPFTDDDYLLAAPVVLGYAFNDKLWLEFPVANVSDIKWNESAFDSLVLPDAQKDIVRALVETHAGSTNNSSTIDDIIQGKGRGLVSVLHGPPGVGKTLTAEGIAELLKRPLYCVSSGELGTNPMQLEHELNKILDIAHSWSAVLLLDEADVFLERRTMADMHRNALVSIFLRTLEYFSGILFLTTNRVETFDDAFQSRIHVALRYGELGFKAKLKIWTMFLGMVRTQNPDESEDIVEEEIDWLAKRNMNGRQIKNAVRTAQALAKSKGEKMCIRHVKTVLGVAEGFENDLKGTGRLDSLNAYA